MNRESMVSRRSILRIAMVLPIPMLLAACGALSTPTGVAPAGIATPPSAEPTATTVPVPTRAPPTPTPAGLTPVAAAPTANLAGVPGASPTTALAAAGATILATPECGDVDDATPPQTAGPFYTPDTPMKKSLLEPNMAGTRLILAGQVVSTACQPVDGALLDFWQADDAGAYDNVGFRLRGHQFADPRGEYRLETILPGLYPGRTRHIHVRIQAPNRPALTTQLYFPDETGNARDGIFNPALTMEMRDAPDGGKLAAYHFVLNLG